MTTFFKNLWAVLVEVFSRKEGLAPLIPNVPPSLPDFEPTPPQPPVPPEPDPKYLWDTPDHAHHSVRLICDEEGLNLTEKNLICQVIRCESGFKTDVTQVNRDQKTGKILSTDYGICQMNSYWYIGNNRPIKDIEEALHDPEKCVRIMIKRYREGGLTDWVCYSSGKFRRYIS